jgi:hypothetical protein
MKERVQITKIEITTKDGVKIPLSIAEAKDLHSQLDELFGVKEIKYYPYAPIILDRTIKPYWSEFNPVWTSNTVSCSGISGLSMLCTTTLVVDES